jgi:succinate dehydrogenase subunit D
MTPPGRQHIGGHRRNALWLAFMVHRLSGLALACFLPLHFLTLGLAISGEARLEGALRWMDNPMFKVGETALVILLAVHMLGGMRLLLIENMPWREGQKNLAAGALILAAIAGLAFLVRAI